MLACRRRRRYTPRLVCETGPEMGMPGRDSRPAIFRGRSTERRSNAQDEDQVVGQEAVQDHRDRQGARRPRQ